MSARAPASQRRRARRAMVLWCAALLLLLGCQAILGIEDTRNDPSGIVNEGGTSDTATTDTNMILQPFDGGDQPDPTDADIIFPSEAGTDDGGETTGQPDASCNPTSAFIPVTPATGTVCNPNNALPNVSGVTGLDFTNNVQKLGTIADKNVTACSGVTFPKALTQVTVRLAASAKGCDRQCVSSFCGTGHTAHIFALSNGTIKYLATPSLTSSYADFKVNMPPGVAPTQIFVCRAGWSGERDDVVISTIYGTCVP